ncbi:MAG TPA: DUF3999 domain-containing protein [Dokdonella sp.]
MKRRAFAFFLLSGTLRCAAAATPADYAYTFALTIDAAAPSSAWRVELTPEVCAWVQDDALRDIEIFNAAGQPVPLGRMAGATTSTVQELDSAIPVLALPATTTAAPAGDLRLVIDRDASGRLRRIDAGEQAAAAPAQARDWLLDASSVEHAIERIQLDWTTPTSGIVARFSIEASDDLQSWRTLGNATVLALEQNGARLERRELALGNVRAKYLRLHRLDDGAELGGLSAHARMLERSSAAPLRAWLRADATGAAQTQGNAVRFHYQLPAALPLDRARIELAGDNSLAPLTLFARMPGSAPDDWRELARVTAFRLHQGEEYLQNDVLDLRSGGRVRELRIDSSTPLAAAPQLTVGFPPDSLVFLAEGSAPYTLAAGSLHARHADYPVDAALASLRAKYGRDWQPPPATLGAAVRSAGDAALRAPAAPLPWRSWILWVVLVAGAALVGAFAVSLLKGAPRER